MLLITFIIRKRCFKINLCVIWSFISEYKQNCCCCSVTKSRLTHSVPMYCSVPSFPALPYLPESVHSRPLNRWCRPTISSSVVPFSFCLQSFPASESFPMSWLFLSGGQSIEASASASVLLINIQDWFPLGLTGPQNTKIILKATISGWWIRVVFPYFQVFFSIMIFFLIEKASLIKTQEYRTALRNMYTPIP